ncbi:cysteine--tRNA ligase [Kiritimatiellaeota bacterium B1221]|nr:cysteine--tRNA ligase [Kiritimatiellaeota bacterium B1221]
MKFEIYDTLSRQNQPVEAANGKTLGFYCCGPTVYAAAHIGNFRTFVVQDVFRRVAELSGVKVKHVRNITNVDDKTIRVSMEQGRKLEDFTKEWTGKFHEDCAALNLLSPMVEPGAVEHIQEQIDLIASLVDKGVAYQAKDGSVFFRIEAFPEYGRLSGVKDRELTTDTSAQADDEYGRDSMADFALWKTAKPEDGDNVWDSPWGKGRPGWHLECSAMSMKYLGPSFDVHSGGIDLAFPHHENEIAQSEACTGQTFSRLWFHVVHLMVDGKKMSKSLGNMYTLADLEAKGFQAPEVRYGLIAGHYRKHLNFTVDALAAHRSNLERLARLSDLVNEQSGHKPRKYQELCKVSPEADGLGRFAPAFASLLDNLNVPKALGEVFRVAGQIEKDPASVSREDARGLERVVQALGLILPETEAVEVPEEVVALAEERLKAKADKNWAASDRLRDEISAKGWAVKDVAGGYELVKV